jgi:hypothetical protein
VVVELNMRLPVHYRNMSHNQLQGNLADIDGLAQFEEILGQGTALAYNLFTCPLPQWAMYATPCVSSMERNSYDTQQCRQEIVELTTIGLHCIGTDWDTSSLDSIDHQLRSDCSSVDSGCIWRACTRCVQAV